MTDQMNETPVADVVVVARVPVVDSAREIVGFELINRSMNDSGEDSPDAARQAVVTVSSLLGSVDVNLSAVVGDKLLFCTVERDVVLSATPLNLPPRKTVLEVPSDDADLSASIEAYKRAGFTILMEHQTWTEETLALLALADLVKIDLSTGAPGEIMDLVDGYKDVPVELVAARCDTEAEFSWAQAVGFHRFIGRAVQAQETTSDSASAPLPLSQLQLSLELLSEDLDFYRIEEILRGDPALIVQLLSMASNGAGGGLRREVRSLREALVVLGTVRLKQWAALVILSRHSQRQGDALVTTLVRARMCELLALSRGIDGPFAFTAGLLSALNILLGVPAKEIEQQIKVGDELTEAAFRRRGAIGHLITRVEDHERWFDTETPTSDDHDEVTLIGAMAFSWAASYAEVMDSSAPV